MKKTYKSRLEEWNKGTKGKILYISLIALFLWLSYIFSLKALDTGSYWYYTLVLLYIINIVRLGAGLIKMYVKT